MERIIHFTNKQTKSTLLSPKHKKQTKQLKTQEETLKTLPKKP